MKGCFINCFTDDTIVIAVNSNAREIIFKTNYILAGFMRSRLLVLRYTLAVAFFRDHVECCCHYGWTAIVSNFEYVERKTFRVIRALSRSLLSLQGAWTYCGKMFYRAMLLRMQRCG